MCIRDSRQSGCNLVLKVVEVPLKQRADHWVHPGCHPVMLPECEGELVVILLKLVILHQHHLGALRHLSLQSDPVSYTHLRAHETVLDLVCRLLLEKKKYKINKNIKIS
eukprot:TRINITY_DN26149_c0_g1_i1.p1 TRINITY_DN26149_c0_g1~~TRINITY_DN26149_c0_g1_i1.p1  ORF type:complete len:109 (-),score=41.80 TRINITY_DN26149_c0_g1_i1:53-379(-)